MADHNRLTTEQRAEVVVFFAETMSVAAPTEDFGMFFALVGHQHETLLSISTVILKRKCDGRKTTSGIGCTFARKRGSTPN
jgi:hypothetical protein